MELVDADGASVEVQVWDGVHDELRGTAIGEDIAITVCTATREGQQEAAKLNLCESGHALRGGPIDQFLTGLGIEGKPFRDARQGSQEDPCCRQTTWGCLHTHCRAG